MRGVLAFVAVSTAVLAPVAAAAQTQGGTLRISHRDNPPSASIHEESTISVNQPFMGVFNNLVVFDPKEKRNSPDHIVPDLAESWAWDESKTRLTFKLRSGVKGHWSYRTIAWLMKQKLAARYPALGDRMQATSPDIEDTLTR